MADEAWRDNLDQRIRLDGGIVGVGVNDGWRDLIFDLVWDLDAMGVKYQIEQVKEKFGKLRFYAHIVGDATKDQCDAFRRRIEACELRSSKVCETCGAPGSTRNINGWVSTACSAHERKYEDGNQQ